MSIKPPLKNGWKDKRFFASKWMTFPILLSDKELEALFNELALPLVFPLGQLVPNAEARSFKDYIEDYRAVLAGLIKEGAFLKEKGAFLCAALADNPDRLYRVSVGERELVKIKQPVLQVQLHFMRFSNEEKKFYLHVRGQGSFVWGLSFSYPQIYQDLESGKMLVSYPEKDSYAKAIQVLRAWQRKHTKPTTFCVDGTKLREPVRISLEAQDFARELLKKQQQKFDLER